MLGLAVVGCVAFRGLAAFTPAGTTCLTLGREAPEPYRWLAARPGGAVLDLRGEWPRRLGTPVDDAAAMLGNLVHRHPVLNLHTHHVPIATEFVRRTAERVNPQTLRAIVDMTRLRWVVLPPETPGEADSRWARLDRVKPVATFPDGRVLEVLLQPRFGWFDALSRAPRGDRTLLGTPLGPVASPRAVVTLTVPPFGKPADRVPATITITNVGPTAWPVVLPPHASPDAAVKVTVEWRGGDVSPQSIELPYDVEPRETVKLRAWLATPVVPGLRGVSVHLSQGGTAFLHGAKLRHVMLQ